MNFKNRLSKIEIQTGVKDKICRCFPQHCTESYKQDGIHGKPQLMGDPVPDNCPKCGKAIEKTVIFLQFIESHITKPADAK